MFVSFVGYSQVPDENDVATIEDRNNPNYIHTVAEVMPEYPDGGINGFRKFVMRNFRTPDVDRDVKGKVVVSFVVEPDGSLSNIKVVEDLDYGIGEEVVRVIKESKKWEAGIQDGKPVRVTYTFPLVINIYY